MGRSCWVLLICMRNWAMRPMHSGRRGRRTLFLESISKKDTQIWYCVNTFMWEFFLNNFLKLCPLFNALYCGNLLLCKSFGIRLQAHLSFELHFNICLMLLLVHLLMILELKLWVDHHLFSKNTITSRYLGCWLYCNIFCQNFIFSVYLPEVAWF